MLVLIAGFIYIRLLELSVKLIFGEDYPKYMMAINLTLLVIMAISIILLFNGSIARLLLYFQTTFH